MPIITKKYTIYPMGSNKPHMVVHDGELYLAVQQSKEPIRITIDKEVENMLIGNPNKIGSIITNTFENEKIRVGTNPKESYVVLIKDSLANDLGRAFFPFYVLFIKGGERIERINVTYTDIIEEMERDEAIRLDESEHFAYIPIIPTLWKLSTGQAYFADDPCIGKREFEEFTQENINKTVEKIKQKLLDSDYLREKDASSEKLAYHYIIEIKTKELEE